LHAEQQELRDLVDRSVQIDPHRQELTKMSQTIAEALKEEGRLQGQQKEAIKSRRVCRHHF